MGVDDIEPDQPIASVGAHAASAVPTPAAPGLLGAGLAAPGLLGAGLAAPGLAGRRRAA
ncbi:hypothetical protein [Albimonas pacifica]|uniref:Uncharacterized protein n=1 Tax=Albimonas pacifica TaxID=1114924 RepID=A0A1I3HKY5_9RHOB|nr:hypothetical protein [Albimonas pacifica]SFI36404.1 hypothetical protein SAMN05216258_10655 [Albimonas pacifica]